MSSSGDGIGEFEIIFTNESTSKDDGYLIGLIQAKFCRSLRNAKLFFQTEAIVHYNLNKPDRKVILLTKNSPDDCQKHLSFTQTKLVKNIDIEANETQTYKFCINFLPDQLPTFISKYGTILYKASVLLNLGPVCENGNKVNDKKNGNSNNDDLTLASVIASAYYKVPSKLNLNVLPEAATRISITKHIPLGKGNCLSEKSLKVNWFINKSGFTIGDSIDIKTTITTTIENCKYELNNAVLYQVIVYNPGPTKQYQRTELTRGIVMSKVKKNEDLIINENMYIPDDVECSTSRCVKCWIDIYYEIEFSITLASLKKTIVEKAEIYIGSNPLNFEDLLRYASLTYNIPMKPLSSSSSSSFLTPLGNFFTPSAPPPPPYSREDLSLTSPPSSADICLISNPEMISPKSKII
ncbi:hypothetical protein HELRODRAFT_169824 [Helobdella robusta]|uniref:Arrestin C-terminal-like domain-containing protein n=1 Tax=Helobdella robusta TaxID=6412 RepID=T1F2C6_HELRO|nr:hypothetical protein HELRODRAFT_169824 [Helobdella robusta]ESO08093.1 hypothetical protein HELRODRAFT_169824 [Helobdella robusta]